MTPLSWAVIGLALLAAAGMGAYVYWYAGREVRRRDPRAEARANAHVLIGQGRL